MTAWDDLVSVALVGTERKPVPAEVVAATAAALGAVPPAAAPERSVLTAAGVLAAHRRAGWTPPPASGPPPAPAPPDDRPLASATALQLLELLLTGQVSVHGGTAFLVAEWLGRCAASGRRPPDHLLPRLLTGATGDRSLRLPTLAAGGDRLRWLAGRNPEWAWAATSDPVTIDDPAAAWATGDRGTRLAVLADRRAVDPDGARQLVEETWSGESAKDRAEILAAFATGLGPTDEPFLEAALDDRAAAVRAVAADLLARLPGSRLAARMAERLRPLVRVEGRLRKRLEVAYPDDLDGAARRDGVVDAGAPPTFGPKAWHLAQVVAATPLAVWEQHLGLDPAAVVRLADDQPAVLRGLASAAARQADGRWAAAVLHHHPAPALLAVLPPAEADPAIATVLGVAKDNEVAGVLHGVAGPWSARASAAAVARLRACKTGGPLQASLPTLAARLHPGVAPEVERWVADLQGDDHTRRLVRGLAHALSIRQTIAQELP